MGHQTVASVALHYLQPAALTAVNKILAADRKLSTFWAPSHRRNFKNDVPTKPSLHSPKDDYDADNDLRGDLGCTLTCQLSRTPEQMITDTRPRDRILNRSTSSMRLTTHRHLAVSFIPGIALELDASSAPWNCVDKNHDTSGNYTHLVQETSQSATYKAQALKYIIHFIGDITQPLHDENLEVGGNDIDVLWEGASTNLHHIWDTEMITALAGTNTTADITAWTNTIVTAASSGGQYNSSVSSWISCITASAIATANATETCATTWAVDANAYVCSYVLKTDETDKECSGAYYTGAAPIIQEQIAKGGIRLAAWLNMIYTGSTGF
ncbi:hypothetical protein FRB96_008617 [Tulasnella sp. 330]|nr:hypothetical protein FRB96_008617 [Tulasnella sp. 330]KAG8877550.1 hypothetical protein FRB97_003343 [Tulasnella sp. 331]KAG8884218.1 hypothetical protein FRB98_002560 [Tulasnella sp. 332]